jgi:hypothetical protein
MKADISDSGNQQSRSKKKDRRNKMNTDSGDSRHNEVQFQGKLRKRRMDTSIRDLDDGQTVVVYTEDRDLADRLAHWQSCQQRICSSQYSICSPNDHHDGYDLYFPKSMRKKLQFYCRITDSCITGHKRPATGIEFHGFNELHCDGDERTMLTSDLCGEELLRRENGDYPAMTLTEEEEAELASISPHDPDYNERMDFFVDEVRFRRKPRIYITGSESK